jgi:hypothetical protein
MGIDPMNNISNNNKNALCSYIISTVMIEEVVQAKFIEEHIVQAKGAES